MRVLHTLYEPVSGLLWDKVAGIDVIVAGIRVDN